MPEKLHLRLPSELVLDLLILALKVFPKLEVLDDLNPLDLALFKSLLEQGFNFLERCRPDRHVVALKVDLLDFLPERFDPVGRHMKANEIIDNWS